MRGAPGYRRDTPVRPPAAQPAVLDARHPFSFKTRLLTVRTLISLILAGALMLFVIRGLNISPAETWRHIQQVNPWLYALALGVFYLTFPLRALRWRILLHNADLPIMEGRHSWASLSALIEYIGLSWFVNCVVPAKLGDAYRGYLLKHNGNVSFSGTIGTILAERLLDVSVLFALLAVSAWSVFGSWLPPSARWILLLGALLVVLVAVALLAMRWLRPVLQRSMPARFLPVYHSFETGTLGALKLDTMPALFVLTVLVWLCEAVRLLLVIAALGGLRLDVASIMFVALMGSLLTTVPATPGGLGIVEGGIAGVLTTLFHIAMPIAASITVLDRVISFWSILVFGFVLYAFAQDRSPPARISQE